jgi:hypothetical protein
MVGSIRLYRLVQAQWTAALVDVCQATLEAHPALFSAVAPARDILVHGQYSGRAHLRGYLDWSRSSTGPNVGSAMPGDV